MLRQPLHATRRHDVSDSFDRDAALSEMSLAIAAMYFEDLRRLDIRYLWTRGSQSFFRVNWWQDVVSGAARVRRSAFVVVEEHAHGYKVMDVTQRRAA